MSNKAENKKYLELWNQYRDNVSLSAPLDLNETPSEKAKRIAHLEKHPEEWFKYYFPKFYTSEPALFHIRATKRILNHPEWYEVRSWSRELSKTGRTMMEVMYLILTGKKRNVLMVANSYDNALRLLLPYKVHLEVNPRIINDYGAQESIGKWEAGEFVTKKKVSFRALGAGQSPRGTRNDAVRPDVILIDDIDTDEECRNPERIKTKMRWIEQALYPTRSVSEPLLWIANGNIIAEYCCITEMGKLADIHEVINIRDQEGKSTWPSKNTEAFIDRALSKMSWASIQKEYYNNPVVEGDTFKELTYGSVPNLNSCDEVLIYADPATSNRNKGKGASHKSVGIIARKGLQYYLYKVWLDVMSNAEFIDSLYAASFILREKGISFKVHIENNTLQNPFYEQVLLPLIRQQGQAIGYMIPITPDDRKKGEKYTRIEATLEPLNRLGQLILNKKEEKDPHMKRMHSQMLGVSPNQKIMDGPDMLQGGVWILQNRTFTMDLPYAFGNVESRKY